MKFIRQPENSMVCGQCCVAMACDVTLAAVIGYLGADITKKEDLNRAIGFFGAKNSCSIELIDDKHWVLVRNDKVYDPAAGVFRGLPNYLKEGAITECLVILSNN